MKRWKVVLSMITAALFVATAVQAQNVIFSDDFEDDTLDAYNLNIGGSDVSVVTDGTKVAELAHVTGVRTGLGNNELPGMELSRFDFGFRLKVLSSPAPDDASLELSRDSFSSGLERILSLNLDDNVPTQDAWHTFRVIVNNTASSLVYDQGGGIAGTVLAGEADVWRNGSVYTNMALHISGNDSQSVVTQGEAASSFGFICNKAEANTSFRVDDIIVRDLPQTALVFATSPSATLGIPLDFPATESNNTLYTWFHEAGSSVDIDVTSITIKDESNPGAFTTTATPFSLATPSPTLGAIDVTFDNSVALLMDTQNATGIVEVVWTEVGSGVSNIVHINIQSTYSNPDAELVISPSDELALTFKAPATTANGTVSATYIEGKLLTNVQISAISVINESDPGSFSHSVVSFPIVIPDPASNETFEVVFSNSVAGLVEGGTATGQVVITWNEIGSTNNTTVLPVSASLIQLPVMELNFDVNPNRNLPSAGGNDFTLQQFNNYSRNTNSWNGAASPNYGTTSGDTRIKNSSGSNSRGMYNLIQSGTAGMDDIGAVDTVPLTSGLYRYDFTYAVIGVSGGNDNWGIEAYALQGQDAVAGGNHISWDHGNGGVGSYTPPAANGSATFDQHDGGGILQGEIAIAKTTGSLTVNVTNGNDAVFTVWCDGGVDIELYGVVLTRIGDYEVPVPPTSPTNAVLDASFADASTTNSLWQEFDYDTNDDPSNTWVHAATTSWAGGALKLESSAANSRSLAILTQGGTAGYDDVGANDTIALTSGTYTVSMDIAFGANGGAGSVTVFSFGGQDATGNVNDVRLDLGEGTNDAVIVEQKLVPILRGTAFFTELARKDYSANAIETLTFTGLSVQDGEDLCIRWNNYANADFTTIDNVQVLRTGGAAPVGFDAWVASFSLTGDDALPGTDYEPDGLDNLMEYALGGNPTNDDAAVVGPEISTAIDTGTNWFYHVYNERTDDPRLSYELGRKLNLVFDQNWTTGAIEFVGESVEDSGFKSVTNRSPTAANAAFLRLNVEKTD
jgi:hypothetical protein